MAIMIWSSDGDRNVAQCADNQNVLSWAEKAISLSHLSVPNRTLKASDAFCPSRGEEVFLAYVRGDHIAYADGLTGWSRPQLEYWVSSEGMAHVDAASRLWEGMSLPYNLSTGESLPPITFSLLGHIMHFFRSYNYRVCEWRPSHYAVASVLENWGAPVYSDQILDIAVHDILVRRASRPMSVIGDSDIFLLIGYCNSWAEILDFRRTVLRRSVRYDAMIVPFWLRDGEESALWTSPTLIDTALAGDPRASGWMVYCSGGIASHQFDLSPSNAELRTMVGCYRLVGQECEEDPEGSSQAHSIPNSSGKFTIINSEWGAQYSRYSHIPQFAIDSLYGLTVAWPMCVSTGLQPTHAEKVVMLGGHIGLLDEEITIAQCEWMTPRVYPCGIARRIFPSSSKPF